MEGTPNLCKIIVAGVTIKDDDSGTNYVQSWVWSDTLSGEPIKTININCPRTITNVLNVTSENLLDESQEVFVYRGVNSSDEELVFRGIVTDFKINIGNVTLMCADKLYTTTKKDITYSYDKDVDPSAGVLSEIFKDAINTYTDLTADDDSVVNSGTILTRDKIICKADNVYNIIKTQIAEPLGWNFYYSPIDDKVHFEPFGIETNSTDLVYGVNLVNNPVWDYDKENLYNVIKVYGAEQEVRTIETGQIGVTSGYTTSSIQLIQIPNTVMVLCDASNPPTTEKKAGVLNSTTTYDYSIDITKKQIIWNTSTFTPGASDYVIVDYIFNQPKPISLDSPESQATYNCINTKTFIKNELKSVSDARLFAQEMLSKYKDPVISTLLKVTNVSNLFPGQKIRVVDSQNDIDSEFIVTRITKRYPYAYDEIEVYSTILEKDDFFISIARKLQELDRQAKDDFNFLIQVKSFENETIYENRSLNISRTNITGTTGIYDSLTFSIWDTSTYYDANTPFVTEGVFLENANKKYVELFYDADLKDSATGDWDTTNQWLELEDTEDAISELIAYDRENSNNNAYKSCNISITGTGLDSLDFYLGEFDGTTTTYSQVTLTGSSTSKTGSINLIGSNKRGINWKAEADGGAVVMTQLNITYTK